tara:strand:+ start:1216 stop:1500 length:285 start_codon:yes stop_codon:yes gene_type:complete
LLDLWKTKLDSHSEQLATHPQESHSYIGAKPLLLIKTKTCSPFFTVAPIMLIVCNAIPPTRGDSLISSGINFGGFLPSTLLNKSNFLYFFLLQA